MTSSVRRRIVLVVSVVLLVAAGCDWSHYRGGPTLAGVAAESTIGLGNVATLTERWRGNGPDAGAFDSPVATGGKVYEGQAVFDAAGGSACTGTPKVCAPLWTLPADLVMAPTTVAGGKQYRVPKGNSTSATLSEFDAAGVDGCSGSPKVCQPLRSWKHIFREASDNVQSFTAPVVVGTTLYGAGYGQGVVVDLSSGAGCTGSPSICPVTWSAVGQSSVVRVGPVGAAAVANGTLYLQGANAVGGTLVAGLYAFDAAGVEGCSGVPKQCLARWTGDLGVPLDKSTSTGATPPVVDGVVYAVASWQTAAPPPGQFIGTGVAKVVVFDAAGVQGCAGTPKVCQPLWTAPLTGNAERVWTAPAVAGGRLYVPTESGVSVFDAKGVAGCTGTPKVCSPIATMSFGSAAGTRGGVTIANGVAYVGSMDGLFAFDANLSQGCSGAPLVCQPVLHVLAGTNVTTPAVVAGQVHVLSNGQVVTFGLP
ncbi:MAG: PQQ-binding-like beta-propeller repeat protein [Acidimicrobiales bacterium]